MKAIMENIRHPEQRKIILEDATPFDLAIWILQTYADDRKYILHPEKRLYLADHVEILHDGDIVNFDDAGIVVDAKRPADRYVLGDYKYYIDWEINHEN